MVYGNEADAECARRSCFAALVAGSNILKPVEVATMTVGAISFPGALGFLNLLTVTEDAIVVDDQRIILHIEAHRGRMPGVVCVLYQLVCKRPISPEIAKLRAQVAEVVDASAEERDVAHLSRPSEEHKWRTSHSLQIAASGGVVTANSCA